MGQIYVLFSLFQMFCLSKILNFGPTFIRKLHKKNLDFWFLLKSSEVLTMPETVFLYGNNEQELTHTTSKCLPLRGFNCMLLTGLNRYLCLQLLLQSLRYLLLPSELPLDFLSFASYLLYRFGKAQ